MRLQSHATSGGLFRLRWDVELVGQKNGVNTIFKLPSFAKFINDNGMKIRVHTNGQRLHEGALDDFTVLESGGPGAGFDTVVLAVAPNSWERITADYMIAS